MEDDDIPAAIPSMWQPMTRPVDVAILGKLGEELSELMAAKERCLVQGIDESDPGSGKLNRVALEDEIADVLSLLKHTIDHYGLDHGRIERRHDRKYLYIAGWFHHLRGQT